MFYFSGDERVPVGMGKNVCQTVLLFDGLSVHVEICDMSNGGRVFFFALKNFVA